MFQAKFGFYDTVVAAPSQAAALRAWGIHQNLFATGEATVATDEAAVAAAVAHPETPLRRAIGSTDSFELEPTSLPQVPDAPKARTPVKQTANTPTPAARKPVANRCRLDATERTLRELDDRRKREEATFRYEEEALEARRQAAQSAYVEARKAATSKVVDERSAYRKAGGEA